MSRWRPWWIYMAMAVVLVVSFLATWVLPVSEFFKGLMSVPGMAAMVSILAQVWRDQLDYERRLALQLNQQDFILGITSDMAKVAYSKHFEFCEAIVRNSTKACANRSSRDLQITPSSSQANWHRFDRSMRYGSRKRAKRSYIPTKRRYKSWVRKCPSSSIRHAPIGQIQFSKNSSSALLPPFSC